MNVHGLFTAHRDGVFRYLCRVVGPAQAGDLTQEVFLRVTRGPVPDAPDDGQRAWIFAIARNLALNHIRDAGRRPGAPMPEPVQPPTQEIGAAVTQALGTLSSVDRDIFLLRETVGLSYEEIAVACQVTPDAVRSRLHRTRQALRESLRPLLRDAQRHGVRLYDKHGRDA